MRKLKTVTVRAAIAIGREALMTPQFYRGFAIGSAISVLLWIAIFEVVHMV